jgi:hypothetical protein
MSDSDIIDFILALPAIPAFTIPTHAQAHEWLRCTEGGARAYVGTQLTKAQAQWLLEDLYSDIHEVEHWHVPVQYRARKLR